MQEVDRLARMCAVAKAELSVRGTDGAIAGGVALPAGNDVRVLGNPGAVVVFDREVELWQASNLFQRFGLGRHRDRAEQEGRHVVGEPDGARSVVQRFGRARPGGRTGTHRLLVA